MWNSPILSPLCWIRLDYFIQVGIIATPPHVLVKAPDGMCVEPLVSGLQQPVSWPDVGGSQNSPPSI